MAFQEKSAWILLFANLIVGGVYAAKLNAAGGINAQGWLLPAIVLFIMLVATAHIVSAIISPKESDVADERDKEIERKGEMIASFMMSGVVLFILAYAALNQLWLIANVAFIGLIAAEFIKAGYRISLYRLGA